MPANRLGERRYWSMASTLTRPRPSPSSTAPPTPEASGRTAASGTPAAHLSRTRSVTDDPSLPCIATLPECAILYGAPPWRTPSYAQTHNCSTLASRQDFKEDKSRSCAASTCRGKSKRRPNRRGHEKPQARSWSHAPRRALRSLNPLHQIGGMSGNGVVYEMDRARITRRKALPTPKKHPKVPLIAVSIDAIGTKTSYKTAVSGWVASAP